MGAIPGMVSLGSGSVSLGLGGGSKTAGNVMALNTQLLKNQMALFTKLQPKIRKAAALAATVSADEGLYAVGGEEPSFFEANKTAILVGGGVAVLLAAVLIMRRR
jgi:hypothetical protein